MAIIARILIGLGIAIGTFAAGRWISTPDTKTEKKAREHGCLCSYGHLTIHTNKSCPLHGRRKE